MDDVNISIPLRMLEVFTSPKTYYWVKESDEIASSVTLYLVLHGRCHLFVKKIVSD